MVEDLDMSLADEGTLRSEGTNSLAEMVVALSESAELAEQVDRDCNCVGEKGVVEAIGRESCLSMLARIFRSISAKKRISSACFFFRASSSRADINSSGFFECKERR